VRVLIADRLAPFVAEQLEAAGCAVTVDPALDGAALTAALRALDPEVLCVRSTKVTAEHIEAGNALSLILRAGAGTNTIDVDAASLRGIYVSNCPGRNAVAVAELVFGHLINLDRRLVDNAVDLRAGRWRKKEYEKARGLKGRTLAILGMGQIGQEVAVRARAFGMEVRAWSRSLTPEAAAALGVGFAATPLDACRGAHAVTVHGAQTAETRHLLNERLLEALAPGAYVINTSRDGVLDHAALLRAIERRGLRAGLDVFPGEPSAGEADYRPEVAASPAVYGSHHIGASTNQASDAVGQAVVDGVVAFLREGRAPDCVNLATETPATCVLVVRHADRVGVLAGVLEQLRQSECNVQEMENIIFKGAAAAVARIQLDRSPAAEGLARIAAHPDVFAASIVPLEA